MSSPPTSSTPRPASCAPSCRRSSAEYDITVGRENVYAELLDLQAALDDRGDAGPDRRRRAASRSGTTPCGARCTTPPSSRPRSRGGSSSGWSRSTTSASTSRRWTSSPRTAATRVRLQPRVVEAGHHSRELRTLTGLDVEEQQARRMLNDIARFSAHLGLERAAARGGRQPVAARDLRAAGAVDPAGAAGAAGAGGDLPRGARAPVVPLRARRPRGRHLRGGPRTTSRTCSPTKPGRGARRRVRHHRAVVPDTCCTRSPSRPRRPRRRGPLPAARAARPGPADRAARTSSPWVRCACTPAASRRTTSPTRATRRPSSGPTSSPRWRTRPGSEAVVARNVTDIDDVLTAGGPDAGLALRRAGADPGVPLRPGHEDAVRRAADARAARPRPRPGRRPARVRAARAPARPTRSTGYVILPRWRGARGGRARRGRRLRGLRGVRRPGGRSRSGSRGSTCPCGARRRRTTRRGRARGAGAGRGGTPSARRWRSAASAARSTCCSAART